MTGKLRVLIDLNLILDMLQKREPFYVASAQVLACVETGLVEGLVAAHTIPPPFLLDRQRSIHGSGASSPHRLLHFLSVAAVDHTTIEQALGLPYDDFEDAVQMMAAVQAGAQYVVTRNIQDYRPGPLPVLQPAELLTVV